MPRLAEVEQSLLSCRISFVITIVSGLPRCGTSLMMQMLAAGGMSALTDGERQADTDNPRGYFEWEQIKQLPKQPDCIGQAEGRVVKCISQLLFSLPKGHDYKVIFMQRPLPEVLASQTEMIRRRGSTASPLSDAAMQKAFESHLKQIESWFKGRPEIALLRIPYHNVLHDPRGTSEKIQSFLSIPLDIKAMAAEVVPSLYRQRTAEITS